MGRQAIIVSGSEELALDVQSVVGPDWVVDSCLSSTEALTLLSGRIGKELPGLLVTDFHLDGVDGLSLLKLIKNRLGEIPPSVLVIDSPLSESFQSRAEAFGLLGILQRPYSSVAIERCLSPVLWISGGYSLSLFEFLGLAYRSGLSGLYRLSSQLSSFDVEVSEGWLIQVCSLAFSDSWRLSLAQRGLALPEKLPEPLEDLHAIESSLPMDQSLAGLKQQVLLSFFSSLPSDEVYSIRHFKAAREGRSIPIEIPKVLILMSELIPEASLEPLKSEDIRLGPGEAAALAGLALTPQHGYLLSRCAQGATVLDIVRSGILPEAKVLREVYLLLTLGAATTDPPLGSVFCLALMKDKIAEEERRIKLQTEAIMTLKQSMQSLGQNPYEILGVPTNADLESVRTTYETMLKQMSPENLHPKVRKKLEGDITWICAKLGEAFLLIQASYLQDREVKLKQQAQSGSLEVKRIGSDLTQAQQISENRREEAERLFKKALGMMEEEEYHEAMRHLQLALFYNPYEAKYHHFMGRLYESTPSIKAKHMAERSYLRAIDLEPFTIEYQFDVANLYLEQELFARCKAHLDRAEKINARDPRVSVLRKALKEKSKE